MPRPFRRPCSADTSRFRFRRARTCGRGLTDLRPLAGRFLFPPSSYATAQKNAAFFPKLLNGGAWQRKISDSRGSNLLFPFLYCRSLLAGAGGRLHPDGFGKRNKLLPQKRKGRCRLSVVQAMDGLPLAAKDTATAAKAKAGRAESEKRKKRLGQDGKEREKTVRPATCLPLWDGTPARS